MLWVLSLTAPGCTYFSPEFLYWPPCCTSSRGAPLAVLSSGGPSIQVISSSHQLHASAPGSVSHTHSHTRNDRNNPDCMDGFQDKNICSCLNLGILSQVWSPGVVSEVLPQVRVRMPLPHTCYVPWGGHYRTNLHPSGITMRGQWTGFVIHMHAYRVHKLTWHYVPCRRLFYAQSQTSHDNEIQWTEDTQGQRRRKGSERIGGSRGSEWTHGEREQTSDTHFSSVRICRHPSVALLLIAGTTYILLCDTHLIYPPLITVASQLPSDDDKDQEKQDRDGKAPTDAPEAQTGPSRQKKAHRTLLQLVISVLHKSNPMMPVHVSLAFINCSVPFFCWPRVFSLSLSLSVLSFCPVDRLWFVWLLNV